MWDIAQRSGLGPDAHTGCHQKVGSRVHQWELLQLAKPFTLAKHLKMSLPPPYPNRVTTTMVHTPPVVRENHISLTRISCCPQKQVEAGFEQANQSSQLWFSLAIIFQPAHQNMAGTLHGNMNLHTHTSFTSSQMPQVLRGCLSKINTRLFIMGSISLSSQGLFSSCPT